MAAEATAADSLATLLVSCADKKGIVAALAQLLYGHGCNILDADQHTDPAAQQFFQRIRFDLSELRTDRVSLEHGIDEVGARFGLKSTLRYADQIKRVAIFTSKYEHCLHDLLLRHRAGELPCDIRLIISNHPELRHVAEHFGIQFVVLPVTKENKASQEAKQIELLDAESIDLVVMARYMQILSDSFVSHFPNRIINIHHSFLPAFVGSKPYHRAYERGVKLIGATAHYATAELDEGPIIEQDVVRASHRDSVHDLIRKGRDLEKICLGRAVRWHLEDRILVYSNKTVVFE
jgi:formyltetrahydrofolate deformylase